MQTFVDAVVPLASFPTALSAHAEPPGQLQINVLHPHQPQQLSPALLSASPRVKVWGGGRDSLGEMNLTLAIKFAAGFAVMGMHNWN